MNKKVFHSVSLYSLMIVLAVLVLTLSAVIVSVQRPTPKQAQTLTTSSASDLKVRDTESSSTPSVSDNGSGNASLSGTVTLQAGHAAPVPAGGIAYPCDSCPDASSTSEVMVCDNYCINPNPEPPVPPANPTCNPCRGNTYGVSSGTIMCPMIACRYPE